MASEDYRIQAYKRVAEMTSPEASADEQGSFSPNVAADLVRSSINNGESIRGMVNGQVFGGGAASPIDSVSLAKNEKKQRSTVAEKWSIQNLLATALGTTPIALQK